MPRRIKVKKVKKTKPKKTKKTKKHKGKGLAGDAYVAVVNKLTGSDLAPGEIHALQLTKDGIKPGSFIGPGSDVVGRIKRGSKPVGNVDKTAKAHDLRYSLSSGKADVRKADLKMVSVLNRISKEKSDYKVNIMIGKLPIKSKMFLEDLGIAGEKTFTDPAGSKLSAADRDLLKSELGKLEQEGFGKIKGKGKGKRAPSAWVTHVKKYASENGCSYKQAMSQASKTYRKS